MFSLVVPQIVYAKINVVTTIKPLHSLIMGVVENVTERDPQGKIGPKVDVKLLLNFKSSPHHYSLKPSDVSTLEKADVVFYIDKNLEKFIPTFFKDKNIYKDKTIIQLSHASGIVLLHKNDINNNNKKDVIDPHLWLSIENAKTIIQIITDVLCEYDIENADLYQNNANSYIKALNNTDHKIKYLMDEIKTVPFVVAHDAYHYFINHYGLNFKGALTSDDQHTPGAATLNKFSQLIQKEKIPCVFGEARESNKLLKSIIGKKAKICYLDGEWGVNEAQRHKKESEAYLIMIQNIAENIYGCLKKSMTYTVPNK